MKKPSDSTGKIAKSAGIVSIAVMCSRVLGLVREQVMAALFGAGTAYDSFVVAFRIPNLLRDLFGEGALSAAFVAVFSDYDTNKGEKATWQLANNVLVARYLDIRNSVYRERDTQLAIGAFRISASDAHGNRDVCQVHLLNLLKERNSPTATAHHRSESDGAAVVSCAISSRENQDLIRGAYVQQPLDDAHKHNRGHYYAPANCHGSL